MRRSKGDEGNELLEKPNELETNIPPQMGTFLSLSLGFGLVLGSAAVWLDLPCGGPRGAGLWPVGQTPR